MVLIPSLSLHRLRLHTRRFWFTLLSECCLLLIHGRDCAHSSTVILVVHVFGNMIAAGYLLPEADSTPSWTRFTAEPMRAARAVLMSPVLEELIFRGLMSCVIYNRCRDPKPGCVQSEISAFVVLRL